MDSITLKAFAKINLSLRVTGRRPDGYHNIRSLMQGIDLYDVIKITKCLENGTKYNFPHCTISGVDVYLCTDAKTIPTDMSNLAFKGIAAVLDKLNSGTHGCSTHGLIISIDKRLPVAAGIAGGSGNAAASMLGINALLGYPLSLRELMDAGARAGADVPFSIFMNAGRNAEAFSEEFRGLEEAGPAALIEGIGDIVRPVRPVERYVVLANPGIAVSTRDAYEAIDAIQAAEGTGRYDGEWDEFVNDLEKFTLQEYPEAARLRDTMCAELGDCVVLMSGSGPTMAAYYREAHQAEDGFARMKEISEQEPGWRTWLTTTGISGK